MKHISDISVQLSHVSKEYIVHHEKPTFIEHTLQNKQERFTAVQNLSLIIPRGERVGIIGPNGSGKTTLLKLIAGITSPSRGSIKTKGNIISLIDIEAGFHPDLTGEQNIFLNGLIIGMDRTEIEKKLPQIIEFAQIGNFMDTPLYTYSAGMKYRLGFAIAVHAAPSILLLDEGIAVGDMEFQIKFQNKIKELIALKTTIITVTHWLEFIKKYCTRVIIMKNGNIAADNPKLSIARYKKIYGSLSPVL